MSRRPAKPLIILPEELGRLADFMSARSAQADNGCIEWTGSHATDSRRAILFLPALEPGGRKRRYYAYRVAWFLEQGSLPEDKIICHSCDNPACVNVAHLFLGTDADNVMDMVSKGRHPGIPPRFGEAHHGVKVGDERVAEVRSLWRSGRYGTYADLGRAVGVSRGTVRDWVLGRSRTEKAIEAHVCESVTKEAS